MLIAILHTLAVFGNSLCSLPICRIERLLVRVTLQDSGVTPYCAVYPQPTLPLDYAQDRRQAQGTARPYRAKRDDLGCQPTKNASLKARENAALAGVFSM